MMKKAQVFQGDERSFFTTLKKTRRNSEREPDFEHEIQKEKKQQSTKFIFNMIASMFWCFLVLENEVFLLEVWIKFLG